MAIKSSSRSLVIKLSLLAVVMLGFTYALVPIYKAACDAGWLEATRYDPANPYANVNVNVDTSNTQVDKSRWITVEFVANTNEKMPWTFEAQQKSIRIHPDRKSVV